jgi:3-deoxy-manno-octulosonate cytidylyltransferase (CMP-KDO synthetase)
MKILAVIPSRYASQRFPGKPLADICGKPMVQWIYEATCSANVFSEVQVATDDPRIFDAVVSFGGRCAMTAPTHETGTDRVAEVARNYSDVEVVVNVQGDQPFVSAEILRALVQPFLDGERPAMTTIGCPLKDGMQTDVNAVKVVCDQSMNALYFSRAPIPYFRQPIAVPVFHHIGLYAFRADFLQQYAFLKPTPLEQAEQLEQLRVMENGFQIRVAFSQVGIPEVNTPNDLITARRLMEERIRG